MSDTEKLQGVWSIASLQVEGADMSGGAYTGAQIVMEGDRFTTIGMGGIYGGTFSVDESQTPKTLEMTYTEGPHKGLKSLAIYKLDGDSLTLCLSFTGSPRPTEFKTSPGSNHALETLLRAKSSTSTAGVTGSPAELQAGADPVSQLPDQSRFSDEIERLQGEWTMVKLTMDGQPVPASLASTGRRTLSGSEVTVRFTGEVVLKASMAIDPELEPKSMDYALLAGPNTGRVALGIYDLSGDFLRVCTAPPGASRPTEFASERGDGRTLSQWRRASA